MRERLRDSCYSHWTLPGMNCLQEFLYTNTPTVFEGFTFFLMSWQWELLKCHRWALQSQCGGPCRLLSNWVSLSSLPWTCSAPTLWAVAMAAMSRWAYLMEPSSGWEISSKRGRQKTFVFRVWCGFQLDLLYNEMCALLLWPFSDSNFSCYKYILHFNTFSW